MGFQSILGQSPYHLKASEIEYSSFYQDLNIDLIVERILIKWADYPIQKYFYYPAWTPDGVRYRAEVYEELKDEEFRRELVRFSQEMKQARQFLEYRARLLALMERQGTRKDLTGVSARTANESKYQHLLYDAAREYVHAVDFLYELLKDRSLQSRGFLQLRDFLCTYCGSSEFLELKQDVEQMKEALATLHFQFEVKQNKLTLYEVYDENDARSEFMKRCGMKEPKNRGDDAPTEMKNPFPNILELKEFEGLLLSMLHQPHKDVFRLFREFEKKHASFVREELLQFEEEVQVYLAAHQFVKEMEAYGFAFAKPQMTVQAGASLKAEESHTQQEESHTQQTESHTQQEEDVLWELKDNYDVALACKYAFTPEKVITNDSVMREGERFYVITGPNQGGKTTFARAAGQAVWFHQMGFPVPGSRAALPVFSSLLTHFPQEEDIETGAGRLKEELERIRPMLEPKRRGGFVILNELFTTATSYDALIMGKRIICDFLDRDFFGIYVTHFHKLAESDARVVSLVAQVEDSDERRRTFCIRRAPARGIAYAQTFAEKYRLSSEEIKQRVGSRPASIRCI